MRILFVSHTRERCGIAEYGRLHVQALRANQVDVVEWAADYPIYLPPDAEEYDVIHLNWHPVTINHILPEHLPKRPKISCFFHESAPVWETHGYPVLWEGVEFRWTSEPMVGGTYFQVPCPDVDIEDPPTEAFNLGPALGEVILGTSGIRGEGLDRIIPACERRGWSHRGSNSKVWLPMPEEVKRLSSCTINIAHYHSGYTGQSMAVMTLVAARRPVLINSNRMLRTIKMFSHPIPDPYRIDGTIPAQVYCIEDVEEGIDTILEDMSEGVARRPTWLAHIYRWSFRVRLMIERWEGRGAN